MNDSVTRRELPMQSRAAEVRTVNEADRTIELIWSTGARVSRTDWWSGKRYEEELSLDPAHVDLGRLRSGAPLLNTHGAYDLRDIIGVVERAEVDGKQGTALVRFSERDDVEPIWRDVKSGIIRNVSVGYRVRKFEITEEEGKPTLYRAVDWEPMEISLVPIPADAGAGTRAANPAANPCEFITTRAQPAFEEHAMDEEVQKAGEKPAITEPGTEQRSDQVKVNVTEFRNIAAALGYGADYALDAIERGLSIDAFRREAIDKKAKETNVEIRNHVNVTRDETETRAAAMTEALAVRLGAKPKDDAPTTYRSYMEHSLPELAAEAINFRGRMGTTAAREDVMRRAFHTTSDFPIIFENALNRALSGRYAVQQPTYRRIARQRTYVDFRDHATVRPGDFPDLQPVNEAGELKSGTFTEAKERTAVKPYGVQVALTRQMLVNDTLGAINQVLADQATRVAQFEEKNFYGMFLSNNGAGPTLLEVNRAVFHASNGNLAASGTVLDEEAVTTAYAAFRKMKRQDGEPVDVIPRVLLVGPDRVIPARKLVASVTPSAVTEVNPFSGAYEIVESARITNNAWYLFASPADLPCFEWGLLEGYSAPRMRMDEPFGMQGVKVSLEHDFGCGAIDFRGAYRNPGN